MKYFQKQIIAFVIAMAVPVLSHASDELSLKVSRDKGDIYVIVANTQDNAVKVRKDFLLDRIFGSLTFDIRNHAKVFPDASHINPEVPTESTYTILTPGQIIGHMFNLQIIKNGHMLTKGCYTISAIYHDGMAKDFAGFEGEIRSKPISLCIDK